MKTLPTLIILVLSMVSWNPSWASSFFADQKQSDQKGTEKYLVVSLVPPNSPFQKAADELANRHKAKVLQCSIEKLPEMENAIRKANPTTVAFVVSPRDLDINLAQNIFVISTKMDDDPFVDFAYGFITGRDGKAALKLVEASAPKPKVSRPKISMFGVGSKKYSKSNSSDSFWPLRNSKIPVSTHHSAGDTDSTRDDKFIKSTMPKLSKGPILLLASHGYPNGLVGGPKAADLSGLDLSGSIAFNIACYNGVIEKWYEDDWKSMKVCERSIDPDKSFCLKMIDCGVAGYIAYTCPRPAGPTMLGDALMLASRGQSIGELHREHSNSVVLAHILSGEKKLSIKKFVHDAPIDRKRSSADLVKRMSVGGILIGDPAFTPFTPFSPLPGNEPVTLKLEEKTDRLLAKIEITPNLSHFFTSDPINYWNGNKPATRLETSIPLGNRSIKSVNVLKSPSKEYRFAAAIERHSGKRMLRIKLNFPHQINRTRSLLNLWGGPTGKIEIVYGEKPADSVTDQVPFRSNSKQGK